MTALFEDRLAHLLQEKGITQKELADRTGLTPAAVSRYINGARTPREIVVAKIARELGVQPIDLVGTEGEQDVDEAVQIIARNANILSSLQRERLIKAISKR